MLGPTDLGQVNNSLTKISPQNTEDGAKMRQRTDEEPISQVQKCLNAIEERSKQFQNKVPNGAKRQTGAGSCQTDRE